MRAPDEGRPRDGIYKAPWIFFPLHNDAQGRGCAADAPRHAQDGMAATVPMQRPTIFASGSSKGGGSSWAGRKARLVAIHPRDEQLVPLIGMGKIQEMPGGTSRANATKGGTGGAGCPPFVRLSRNKLIKSKEPRGDPQEAHATFESL